MKRLIKILIILALVLGLGALALVVGEKYAENQVQKYLSAAGISVQNVDFNLPRGDLELQLLKVDIRSGQDILRGEINRISVTSFNIWTLLPSKKDVLPKVADIVSVDGASLFYARPSASQVVEFGCEQLFIEGWRQNLGNLAASLDPGRPAEDFFEQLLSYRVEVLALRAPEVVYQAPNAQAPSLYSADFIGLLGPAGSVTLSPELGRKLSLFANNLSVLTPGIDQYFVSRMEARDLLLPPAAELAKLVDKPLYCGPSSLLSAEQTEQVTTVGQLLDGVYSQHPPYQSLVLENAGYGVDAAEPALAIWLERFVHSLQKGDSLVLDLEVSGLQANLAELDRNYARVIKELGAQDKLNFHAQAELVFDNQASSRLSLEGGAEKLLDLTLEGQFAVKADRLGQLVSYPDFLSQSLWWQGLDLRADANGILEVWTQYLMLAGGMDRESARQAIVDLAGQNLAGFGALARPLTTALDEILTEPGILLAQIAAPEPMPWPILFLALNMNPAQVGFSLEIER